METPKNTTEGKVGLPALVRFVIMKITLVEKRELGLSNRDGEIMVGRDKEGTCYLIAEADTYHNAEVFEGLGSTEHIKITAEAFLSLANEATTDHTTAPPFPDQGGGGVQRMIDRWKSEEADIIAQADILRANCCRIDSNQLYDQADDLKSRINQLETALRMEPLTQSEAGDVEEVSIEDELRLLREKYTGDPMDLWSIWNEKQNSNIKESI